MSDENKSIISKQIKICICDDNPVMLERIIGVCRGAFAAYNVEIFASACFEGLMDGVDGCAIAVLDIQMPGEDGISVSRCIRERSSACQIIFVSSFIRYVSEVYEVPHLCLVMKDQLDQQLPRFLLRALEKLRAEENSLLQIRRRGRTISIMPSELRYIERRGHISYLMLRSGEELQTGDKLTQLMSRLDGNLFCRCHVSFIVSLGSVSVWEKTGFKMDDSTEIPISRAYERAARECFMRYVRGT